MYTKCKPLKVEEDNGDNDHKKSRNEARNKTENQVCVGKKAKVNWKKKTQQVAKIKHLSK